jgi:PAS domain S-box-containing protein
MIDSFASLFSEEGFMPHGMCYLWRPGVLSLHVASDALITLAYASIPFTLVYFVRKRKDLEFSWIFVCFAIFIIACGTTHAMEIWVIWHPNYWLSGGIKAITALASVPTAILLVRLIPDALKVPSASLLRETNAELDRQVHERERAESEVRRMNVELEARVTKRTQELEAANRHLLQEASERKRAEELFQLAVEASPTGMIVVDESGCIMLSNAEALRLFGYSREELLHQPIELLVPERHQTSHVGTRKGYLSAASTRPMGVGRDLMGRRKDGTEFPLEIGLSPVLTSRGPCVIAAVTDLSARKVADVLREEVAQTQAHLAAIVESSDDAIIGNDAQGVVTSWNSAAEALFGYRADEMIGESITIVIPADRAAENISMMRDVFESGQHFQQHDSIRRTKDGRSIDVSITVSPIKDSHGRVVGASKVARDISDRKRAEVQLRIRTEELARSNSELEQFAYSASHDLQEPLRAVAGSMQLLHKRYSKQLDARADEYIDQAVDGAKRMRQLIDDLLEYSRVGTKKLDKGRVDCNEVLNRAKGNLRTAIQETNAQIEHTELPMITGDRTRLAQLLQNLIGNAIKFRRELPPRIEIRCERRANDYLFAIADNGIGMEARHFDRIFGVFQRLHTRVEYPGTGIGLALCAKIVAAHGGRIWVESQPGVGSTFYITLPFSLEDRTQ